MRAITTHDELRAILGAPSERAIQKDIGRIDEFGRQFIARSPMVLVGTSSAAGRCDVSPRGDPPGFVRVLDDYRLAIPERPGNRRGDTLANIVDNPHIGLIFLVPGNPETYRINGRATVVQDDALNASLAHQGKAPKLAIVVEAEQAFFHCGKALIRSRLWEPESIALAKDIPSLAAIMHGQLALDCSVEELEAQVQSGYRATLY
jgi:PPOX class probable FMN-dependent enzyme